MFAKVYKREGLITDVPEVYLERKRTHLSVKNVDEKLSDSVTMPEAMSPESTMPPSESTLQIETKAEGTDINKIPDEVRIKYELSLSVDTLK